MARSKRWQLYPSQDEIASPLAQKLQVHPVIAQVLLNRQIQSLTDAKVFLGQHQQPTSDWLPEIDKAAALLHDAIANDKKILLYGDYDVDGMTSTAQMMRALKHRNAKVQFHIPQRFEEGYGLHANVVKKIKEQNIDLLITLDCGVSNVSEIGAIKEHTQAKVIVMDHHTLPDTLPAYDAMLNPKMVPETHFLYPLCTAGIVYHFLQFFEQTHPSDFDVDSLLDLAALGTIADIAALFGINRELTKAGLKVLSKRQNVGIRALLNGANFEKPTVDSRDVGFVIGPRLNATGRLSTAKTGVELLMCTDVDEADKIAAKLEKMNQDRRQIDSTILKESVMKLEETKKVEQEKVVVLAGHHWHAGVIGITASKLTDKYDKPAVIMAVDDAIGRGSARACGDINIFRLLKSCSHHFETFGGHKQAAGFTIKEENIRPFMTELSSKAKDTITENELRPILKLDAKLEADQITLDFAKSLDVLEPFGEGCPQPLFFCTDLRPIDFKTVGDGSHLKATFEDKSGQKIIEGIGFGLADKIELLHRPLVQVAFYVSINEWQGRQKVQLQMVDIK